MRWILFPSYVLCQTLLISCDSGRPDRSTFEPDSAALVGDWLGAVATEDFNATFFLHFDRGAGEWSPGGQLHVSADGPHAEVEFSRAELGGKRLRLWVADAETPALDGRLRGVEISGSCSITAILTGPCTLIRMRREESAAAYERAFRRDRLGWRGLGEIARVHALEDGVDAAFVWLTRAHRKGMGIAGVYGIPGLEVLYDDARFLALFPDPVAGYPELSQRTRRLRFHRRVGIVMRDGVELIADIALPVPLADSVETFPAILVRTPYGRARELDDVGRFAPRGYAVVSQSVRGREESGGEFDPWINERQDGFDTIDWISRQPWSNGKVGMFGGSYLGQVQWAAAAERHPALAAIVPMVSGSDHFFDVPYSFGVLRLSLIHWVDGVSGGPGGAPGVRQPGRLKTLPLSQLDDEYLGYDSPIWNRWLDRDVFEAWDRSNFLADLDSVTLPVLHLSGWWDAEAMGTKRNHAAMRALGRENQWLTYGPWPHNLNASSRYADVDYGTDAVLNLEPEFVRWFDTWLKGNRVDLAAVPKVRVFVTGVNQWRTFEDWPPAGAEERVFYLSGDAPLEGAVRHGALTIEAPFDSADVPPDQYTYDPAQVSWSWPYIGQLNLQRSTRITVPRYARDALVYVTEPLDAPLDLAGPAVLELFFATSARDTDVFAFVVDIDEQGELRALNHPGKLRLRYLNGWNDPMPLQPDSVYRVTIDLFPFAHRFTEGHRLGVVLRSEFFPAFARNLNTAEPIQDATTMVVARQRVYHDARRPSALRVWELPRGGAVGR